VLFLTALPKVGVPNVYLSHFSFTAVHVVV
jgi:hypothetical protein